ncbi:pf06912 family protein [Chrysochromulina tobinii]|uniref:Pf06912 family protein n=1 Tax=Chrysochromulina tobinii TaxID=1460289 RepID=A0A0M0JN07_9EUKA|nr:pf06912 family protein [Chrysochromulina tobinii]|eukprot:KOO27890.1 pf06912 family protein [Chrysochromulina sp. CCMP291]
MQNGNGSSSDSWLVEVLGGVLSGAEVASVGVTLHEHDVLTLEDAKDLRFDDLKEMGFSVGMRNKLIKAFDAASASPLRLGVGAVCTVSGLAQRDDLNGKKARVVGHDAPKGLWHVTVDGESTKIALRSKNLKLLISLDLANVSGEFVELFWQFWAFVFGSFLAGILVTGRKAPKKLNSLSDRPVRRASIVLIMVGIFLFIGWAATKAGGWKDVDNSVKFAPAMLAIAMGMQNGMTSKHAHAVIRTTHMTGVATDIGLLLGNIARREFMLKYEEKFEMKEIAPDRLSAVRKLTNLLKSKFGNKGLLEEVKGAEAL